METGNASKWGIALLLGTTACGSGLSPKIVEIETLLTSDTQTRLFRFEVEYDGGQVEEVYISADGEVTARSVPTYKDGRITRIEVVDADAELLHTTIVDYDGSGRVTKVQRGEAGEEGEDSLLRVFEYAGDAIQEITYTDTRTNPFTLEEELTSWTESFRYDNDDRVDRITLEGLGDPQIQTLSWGGDGTLKGVALDIGGATVSDTFAYDDEGRVERVNGSDLRRYELTYGDHGYVLEIENTLDDETTTTRYYYDDGSADGLRPRPEVPGEMFFDMRGQNVDALRFDSLELLR